MGYYVKAGLGAALFIGGVVVFTVSLMQLLEIGTCASGNTPYAIAKPCPEGIELRVILLTGSIFAGLVGLGLFAFRGQRPGSVRQGPLLPWGLLAWGGAFAGVGVVSLIHSLTADALPPDGKLGGAIVGGTFLLMGVPALLWVGGGIRRRDRPSPAPGGEPEGTEADFIAKLERLQRRRDSGALTDTEFQLEKSRLMAGR